MRKGLKQAILDHQTWLVGLHCLLPTKEPAPSTPVEVRVLPAVLTPVECRLRYPQWLRDAPASSFRWKLKIPHDHPCPKGWRGAEKDWFTICIFLRELRWKTSQELSFSFCELAAIFHSCGYRVLSLFAQLLTFRELTNLIRKVMQSLSSRPRQWTHFYRKKPL